MSGRGRGRDSAAPADRTYAGTFTKGQARAALRELQRKFPQVSESKIAFDRSQTVLNEGAGKRGYVPLGWADQPKKTVHINLANPSPKEYGRYTVAHEVGHTVEPDLIRNPHRAAQYLDATGQPMGRPWLTNSVQGRGEIRAGLPLQKDRWGLPTQGPDGVHSAPNEKYADDVATAMGFTWGQSGARAHALKLLIQMGLVPKRKKN